MADDAPMEPETGITADPMSVEDSEKGVSKRTREDGEDPEEKGEKRAKIEDEKSTVEQPIEGECEDQKEGVEEAVKESPIESEGEDQKNGVEEESPIEGEGEDQKKSGLASVGPKTFSTSVQMFDYFYKLLHNWTPNLNLNKYEQMVLLELLKKGHLEAERKIGKGVKAFQVRFHPLYKSRCFFLVREDDSVEDFSFRKCVDHILPLPENMQIKHDVNRALRGKGGGRGGRGRGRGGKKN